MTILLASPACSIGCRRCDLECAVLPARLAWWRAEVERLCRERALKPGCPKVHDHLGVALNTHERLTLRLGRSPHGRKRKPRLQ